MYRPTVVLWHLQLGKQILNATFMQRLAGCLQASYKKEWMAKTGWQNQNVKITEVKERKDMKDGPHGDTLPTDLLF